MSFTSHATKLLWVRSTLIPVCIAISQNSIPIGPDGNGDDTDQLPVEGYSPFDERDLPGGYVARFKLYSVAWNACLERVEVCTVPFYPLCADVCNLVSLAYCKLSSCTRFG